MIIGDCPYDGCDGRVWLPIADLPLPQFEKHPCESCGRNIWTKHSRADPCSWTEEGFAEEFIIDEETKKITEKNPPKPLTEKELLVQAVIEKVVENMMIYGTGIPMKDLKIAPKE